MNTKEKEKFSIAHREKTLIFRLAKSHSLRILVESGIESLYLFLPPLPRRKNLPLNKSACPGARDCRKEEGRGEGEDPLSPLRQEFPVSEEDIAGGAPMMRGQTRLIYSREHPLY